MREQEDVGSRVWFLHAALVAGVWFLHAALVAGINEEHPEPGGEIGKAVNEAHRRRCYSNLLGTRNCIV